MSVCAVVVLASSLLAASDDPPADPLRFRHAIDLALQHSGVMSIAAANQLHSRKAYEEVRNHYLPQLTAGSGLGYSYGFPLTLEGSAPAIANFTSQQSLFNLSLRQFLKAAKIDWQAASFDIQDKRAEVILDTAVSYAQLVNLTGKLNTLADAQRAADKAQSITEQRLTEGVDSKLELTRSQLSAARIRLRTPTRKANATFCASTSPGSPDSRPLKSSPTPSPCRRFLSFRRTTTCPSAQSRTAQSSSWPTRRLRPPPLRAKGEHKATMPSADIASQYAYLARFNNYEQYFLNYNANNLAAGLVIRFPFFNPVQKAHAAQADADSVVAHKQADLTRNQVSEDTLKLQRSLRQLQAARDVAKLDWQVSQGELEAVNARVQSGSANLREAQMGQLAVNDKYSAYLDAEFELTRSELQLLRLTGELENWAIPTP